MAVLSIIGLRNKSASLTFGFVWLLVSILLILCGLFIEPYNWSSLIGIPTLTIIGLISLAMIVFVWYATKTLDQLISFRQKSTESIHELIEENRKLKSAIAKIDKKILDITYSSLYKKIDEINNNKVLFVINTLGVGGAENQLMRTMKDFLQNDNEVDLYVITAQGELVDSLPKGVNLLNETYDNISVLTKDGQKLLKKKVLKSEIAQINFIRYIKYHFVGISKMIRSGNVSLEKLFWRQMADTCKKFDTQYDVAIAFTEGASTYYVSKHVKAKSKYSFVHIAYEKAGYSDFIDHGAYDGIDKVFAVSNEVRKSFLKVHPECTHKTYIVENELDAEVVFKKSEEFKPSFDNNAINILSVGRLSKQKAYHLSIKAAKILRDSGIKFMWHVLGDGPLQDELQSLIDKNNLQDIFKLHGRVDNPYPYIRNCDIYVHATEFEGKSIALREAKMLGCAVVVSDVEGNKEQVFDGYDGLICNLNSVDIAAKVSTLINDKNLYDTVKHNACISE